MVCCRSVGRSPYRGLGFYLVPLCDRLYFHGDSSFGIGFFGFLVGLAVNDYVMIGPRVLYCALMSLGSLFGGLFFRAARAAVVVSRPFLSFVALAVVCRLSVLLLVSGVFSLWALVCRSGGGRFSWRAGGSVAGLLAVGDSGGVLLLLTWSVGGAVGAPSLAGVLRLRGEGRLRAD